MTSENNFHGDYSNTTPRSKLLSCECSPRYYLPQRWLHAILGMFIIIIIYCMRISTHILIVRIVKNTTNAVSKSKCPAPNFELESGYVKHGNNDWSQSVQAWIIASFYYGYLPLNFVAGILSDKFGSRWILSMGLLISLLSFSLIPITAGRLGYSPVIVLRFLQGCGQGVIFPAISNTLGHWVPPQERSTLAAVTYSGIPIGSVMAILVTGLLMRAVDGWKMVFYFWSAISLILYIIIIVYFYSNPKLDPFLSEREKVYLNTYMVRRFNQKLPYKKILKDGAVIATMLGEIGDVIVLYFFISYFPKFMDNVLRYSVIDNAVISSIPYIGTLIVSISSGKLADWGIANKNWDIGFVRKFYTVLSNMGPGACVLAIGYSECNHTLVIIFSFLAMALCGFHNAGLKTNILDLTSQYAGFAMALPNAVSCLIASLVPIMCGYLAPDNTTDQWKLIFWIMFIISVVSTCLYVSMGSGKRRRWDYAQDEQEYFTGKVPCFSCCDGVDKDRETLKATKSNVNQEVGPSEVV